MLKIEVLTIQNFFILIKSIDKYVIFIFLEEINYNKLNELVINSFNQRINNTDHLILFMQLNL